MSSHWKWVKRVQAEHDDQRPWAPENGQPLQFKIGDAVVYTNQAGIEFSAHITGFYTRPDQPCGLYANGARYFLDWACPWFPVAERDLRADLTAEQPQGA